MDAEFDPFSTLFKIDSTTLIGTAEEPPLVCSSSTVASITDHQHLRTLKRYTHIKSESLVARLDEVCVQIHFVHPPFVSFPTSDRNSNHLYRFTVQYLVRQDLTIINSRTFLFGCCFYNCKRSLTRYTFDSILAGLR
jgi:hypothetical protein